MLTFLQKILEHLIEQIRKSNAETTKEEETNTSKNADAFIVSESYQEVLNLSREINLLYEKRKIPKTVKKMMYQLKIKMNNLFENFVITSTEIKCDDILVLAMAHINLGRIYLYREHNLNVAKDYLIKCTELLKGKELHYKFISTAIYAHIYLHEIWQKLQQLENCYSLLDKALELYLSYTKEDDYPDPLNVDIFLPNKENSKINLINSHILTLSHMKELYCLQPTNMHKFVIYVHNLLNKQLKTIKDSTDNHMFLCWAEASADLSIYFLYSNRLMEAKIHLAAAEYMTMMYYTLILTDPDVTKSEEKIYNYHLVYIFINQLWAMYGIMLLRSSKERLLQYENNKSCEANNTESEYHSKSEEEITKPLIFVDLEKGLKSIIKYHITDTYVSDLDDIKIIFGNVLRWLDEIIMHFKKTNQFIPQVQIVLCMSKAYKYYVYFEGSKSKQIKVIKQQTKMLENSINSLSSEYNASPEYYYFKKLNFELAITYSTLLDLTSEELDEIEEITDEMRMEMKLLVANVIHKLNLSTNLS
ncbi:KIF-binding protein [Camponotus japonicus]